MRVNPDPWPYGKNLLVKVVEKCKVGGTKLVQVQELIKKLKHLQWEIQVWIADYGLFSALALYDMRKVQEELECICFNICYTPTQLQELHADEWRTMQELHADKWRTRRKWRGSRNHLNI